MGKPAIHRLCIQCSDVAVARLAQNQSITTNATKGAVDWQSTATGGGQFRDASKVTISLVPFAGVWKVADGRHLRIDPIDSDVVAKSNPTSPFHLDGQRTSWEPIIRSVGGPIGKDHLMGVRTAARNNIRRSKRSIWHRGVFVGAEPQAIIGLPEVCIGSAIDDGGDGAFGLGVGADCGVKVRV